MIRTHKEKGNTFCASVLFCSSIFSFTLLSIHSLIYLLNSYQQIIRLNKWMNIGSVSFFSTLRFISSHRYKGKTSKKTSWVCVRVYVPYISFHSPLEQSLVAYFSLLFFSSKLHFNPLHTTPFHFCAHITSFYLRSVQWAMRTHYSDLHLVRRCADCFR